MTDPTTALAAAIDAALSAVDDEWTLPDLAALAIAALPPGWCGHGPIARHGPIESHGECAEATAARDESHRRELDEITADVARLRAIEAAARSVTEGAEPHDFFEGEYTDYLVPVGALDALHAALAAEGERP
ncbi:MAG TPA: hypothetical protein VLM76_13505 [Patescibacteria group bacterium]|nr:hypothetical protein [Patescibacteria group bacterium]